MCRVKWALVDKQGHRVTIVYKLLALTSREETMQYFDSLQLCQLFIIGGDLYMSSSSIFNALHNSPL